MALGARGSLMNVLRKAAAAHRRDTCPDGGLPWPRRLSIACGVAAGMEFLHAQKPPIVHRARPICCCGWVSEEPSQFTSSSLARGLAFAF